MGQMTDNNEKSQAITMISNINRIEGFDPAVLAVDYTDASGQTYKRLPAMAQMAWFRLKYPEGRIAFSNIIEKLLPSGELVYTVTARVYADYRLDVNCFLSEGTATRGYCKEKPSVSPKEWAQTAAIGIALRNAGFGLQFSIAGEDFPDVAPNELGGTVIGRQNMNDGFMNMGEPAPQSLPNPIQNVQNTYDPNSDQVPMSPQNSVKQHEMTYEEKVNAAMQMPCPINKYKGYSLGQVLSMDPSAINWIATKSPFDNAIKEAAVLICEHALNQQASA